MEVLSQLTLPELLALQWANNLTRYFLLAGLTYMVFWRWCFPRFKSRFLYKEMPKKSELLREVKFSSLTTMIFLLPTFVVVGAKDLGFSKIYYQWDELGIGWYAVSYLIVFLLHDTYFYWSHRAMHSKLLYKHFHHTHHLSKEPSPLAAFAFHPLEAVTESLIFIIIPLIMPVHYSVIVLFTLFSLFMNIYGHLGFNLFKPETLRKWPLNMFGHSTHHSWHHRYQKGNYGFYLQFWDRMMGTWKGELQVPMAGNKELDAKSDGRDPEQPPRAVTLGGINS